MSAALADGLLASFLLGQFQINALADARATAPGAAFAEGDDKEQSTKHKDPLAVKFDLPPAEAIDYFKAKKIVSKKEFNQLEKEAKQASFTVSQVYKDDVLRGFKGELETALAEGRTQSATINRFKDILSGARHRELGEFHMETVFRTNMQTAYGVGRRRGLEEVTDDFPFWQYHAVMDDRTRPRHAALNGIIQRADSSFWDEHFPPWDFNCRCSVSPADEIPADYDPIHPSGDDQITLSYDDDGNPFKAEVGPTFIDLSVGNFAGVPRGASMLSAIEAGVERATSARIQAPRSRAEKRVRPNAAEEKLRKLDVARTDPEFSTSSSSTVQKVLDENGRPAAIMKREEGLAESPLRRQIPFRGEMVRERAAYLVGRELGVDVPPTILDADEIGRYSLQKFVSGAKAGWEKTGDAADLDRVALLDSIIGNLDRHSDNWLVRRSGRVVAIDHGLAFPIGEAKEWGNYEAIEKRLAEGRAALTDAEEAMLKKLKSDRMLDQELRNLLDGHAVDLFYRRIEETLAAGRVINFYGQD